MIPSAISGYPIILPEHRHVFHTEHPNWHKAWLDSIHESLKPDDVVIDVGAEQGDLSALVASWVPQGGIVLVEPQPLFWPTIRETFEANGLKPLETWRAFVTDQAVEYFHMRMDGDLWPPQSSNTTGDLDPGFFHLNEHYKIASKVSLDIIANEDRRPTAVVIDVEGSELNTLRSGEELLTQDRPQVWCAIHPEIMRDRYGHDPNELLAFMYRMGYRWDLLAFAGEIHVKFEPR
jgi:FkbM family methyltransferase